MDSHAIIYCFTGTGNAARLARIAAGDFDRRGVRADVSPVECLRIHPAHGGADLIGIVTPVLGFGLPQMAARFLRQLPRGRGRKAFVIIAMGNSETVCVGRGRISLPPTEGIAILQSAFWLRLRGYSIAGACALEMPTNWIMAVEPPDKERASDMTERAAAAIGTFNGAVLAGTRTPGRARALTAAFLFPLFAPVYLLFSTLIRRIGGKWFTVTARCTHCGACAAQCPQGTIRLRGGTPRWGWDCQQCYRCINLCPSGAIEVSGIAVLATCIPLALIRWISRFVSPVSHGRGRAVAVVLCLALMAAAAWLVHAFGARRPGGVPGWHLTRRRRRYREAHFDLSGFRSGGRESMQ
jgi:ferredoxin